MRLSWTFLTNHAQVLLARAAEPRSSALFRALNAAVVAEAPTAPALPTAPATTP